MTSWLRRPYTTRISFQKGNVFTRTTERGTVHVIRYRVRSADGKWRHKAETVNTLRRKDAERISAERLREVNRGLRLPVEITFAKYAAGHWETYISQNLKPSTQASHRSNVKAHLLPMFGKRRLSEISPVQVMDLPKDKAAGGLKPKSPLNLYVLLQKMLNLAVALELLNLNPMQRVPKPKVERIGKPSLSPAQVKTIADNMPQNLKALAGQSPLIPSKGFFRTFGEGRGGASDGEPSELAGRSIGTAKFDYSEWLR
jgi:hypothetical protein